MYIKILMFVVMSMIFVPQICNAGDGVYSKAGERAACFLKIDVGARAAGMGGAYTAIANDATGMCWNPAGLCEIGQREVSIIHNQWFEDIKHGFTGYVQPVKGDRAVGVGIVGLFVDDLERRSSAAIEHEGTFKADDFALIIGYSQQMDANLCGGVNLKIIHQSIDREDGYGAAVDGGVIYSCKTSGLKVSAVMQNLGPRMKIYRQRFSLPLIFRVGTAYRIPNQRVLVCTQISKPMDNHATLHFGAEYNVTKTVALRCGYRYKIGEPEHEFLSTLTGGIGVVMGSIQLDYAYGAYHEFGHVHQVGITLRY
jgi:hypothetical protein